MTQEPLSVAFGAARLVSVDARWPEQSPDRPPETCELRLSMAADGERYVAVRKQIVHADPPRGAGPQGLAFIGRGC